MYADFLLVAMDQIVNQVANARYVSRRRAGAAADHPHPAGGDPRLVRPAQPEPGGLFAHVPGCGSAWPPTPREAYGMLRAAIASDDPVMLFESRRLYPVKGQVELDGPSGRRRVRGPSGPATTSLSSAGAGGADVLAARDSLAQRRSAEVIDLRWLSPLDLRPVLESVERQPAVSPSSTRRTGPAASAPKSWHGWPRRSAASSRSRRSGSPPPTDGCRPRRCSPRRCCRTPGGSAQRLAACRRGRQDRPRAGCGPLTRNEGGERCHADDSRAAAPSSPARPAALAARPRNASLKRAQARRPVRPATREPGERGRRGSRAQGAEPRTLVGDVTSRRGLPAGGRRSVAGAGGLDMLVSNAPAHSAGAVPGDDRRGMGPGHRGQADGPRSCRSVAARAMVAAGKGGVILYTASISALGASTRTPTTGRPRPASSTWPRRWRWSWSARHPGQHGQPGPLDTPQSLAVLGARRPWSAPQALAAGARWAAWAGPRRSPLPTLTWPPRRRLRHRPQPRRRRRPDRPCLFDPRGAAGAMKINDHLYLVGGGDYGFNLSGRLDANSYIIDTGEGLWMIDAGFDGGETGDRQHRARRAGTARASRGCSSPTTTPTTPARSP